MTLGAGGEEGKNGTNSPPSTNLILDQDPAQPPPPQAAARTKGKLQDAYRRVTSHLTGAGWGGNKQGEAPPTPPAARRPISASAGSAFDLAPGAGSAPMDATIGIDDDEACYSRSPKVKKSSYDDHGDHHVHPPQAENDGGGGEDSVGGVGVPPGQKSTPMQVEKTPDGKEPGSPNVLSRVTVDAKSMYQKIAEETPDLGKDEGEMGRTANHPVSVQKVVASGVPKVVVPLEQEEADQGGKKRAAGIGGLLDEGPRSVLAGVEDDESTPPMPRAKRMGAKQSPGDVASKAAQSEFLDAQGQFPATGFARVNTKGGPPGPPSTSTAADGGGLLAQALAGIGAANPPPHQSASSTEDRRPTAPLEKGKCLTSPSNPCSNNSRDNAEGNLIVHENDIIAISSGSVHVVSKSNPVPEYEDAMVQYRVVKLLGQGTFAQVFECSEIGGPIGRRVAVKVVKNKPAYTRQAAVEIDVFKSLLSSPPSQHRGGEAGRGGLDDRKLWIELDCHFFFHKHLCLVFELLGLNLYEVLKGRQFRGMKLSHVREIVRQCLAGMKELASRGIVHCDIKPENILVIDSEWHDDERGSGSNSQKAGFAETGGGGLGDAAMTGPFSDPTAPRIKIIDFGSATYEEQPSTMNELLQKYHYQYHTHHTYIQSRFYRSPEVLVGLPYDSAIDMWSLGCVASELFLGLPILPGMQEHDQLSRIWEMIGPLPDWMMDRGSKAKKYFAKTKRPSAGLSAALSGRQAKMPVWTLKSRHEYAAFVKEETGQVIDPNQQLTNRYFKRKKLADIVLLHGRYTSDDEENVKLFCHFLLGILDPDPWKRWTAQQALDHPFLGKDSVERTFEPSAALNLSLTSGSTSAFWVPRWDPSIYRRKLLCVEKAREKQAAQQVQKQQKKTQQQTLLQRRGLVPNDNTSKPQLSDVGSTRNLAGATSPGRPLARGQVLSPEFSTSGVTAMTDAMTISSQSLPQSVVTMGNKVPGVNLPGEGSSSPPSALAGGSIGQNPSQFPGSIPFSNDAASNVPMYPLMVGSLGAAGVGGVPQHLDRASMESVYGLGSSYHEHIVRRQQQGHSAHLGVGMPPTGLGPTASYLPDHGGVMQSPSMQGLHPSGFDISTMASFSSMPFLPLPQSSDMQFYDGATMQQQPFTVGGDLGYALQRPGVVPGMAGNMAGSIEQYHAGIGPGMAGSMEAHRQMGFAPQTHQPQPYGFPQSGGHGMMPSSGSLSNLSSSLSRSSSGTNMTSPRRVRGNSRNMLPGENANVASRFQLNRGAAKSASGPQGGGPRSLLAQQLETDPSSQRATGSSRNLSSLQETEADGDAASIGSVNTSASASVRSMRQNMHAAGMSYDAVPSSLPQGSSAAYPPSGYYGYATATGTPLMMSAPSTNIDPRHLVGQMPPSGVGMGVHGSVGSYGSYGHMAISSGQHAFPPHQPPAALAPPGHPSSLPLGVGPPMNVGVGGNRPSAEAPYGYPQGYPMNQAPSDGQADFGQADFRGQGDFRNQSDFRGTNMMPPQQQNYFYRGQSM